MKKQFFNWQPRQQGTTWRQAMRVLGMSAFLIAGAPTLGHAAEAKAESQAVVVNRESMKVKELISLIESQTGYLFYYNKSNVDMNRVVRVGGRHASVSQLLDEAFRGTNVRYVIDGKNIVLTAKKGEAPRSQGVQQQKKKVTGKVLDKDGEPIIGASIVEKGNKSNGAVSDMDGNFSIDVPDGSQLVISYLGYTNQVVTARSGQPVSVTMNEEATTIDDVVVTAMGLKKKEASLAYSTQQLKGDELTRAKDPNMINSLAGKSAGVQINRNSSGLGGSAKVIIRGIRSASESGNNQPLYVIDGVPMLNNTNEQAATALGGNYDAGNRDSGDGISNLNPDDIESINILKGASASALYGSQAANGVILITTKKGSAGVQKITFSSNLTFDSAFSLPKFQNHYGEDGNTGLSWGERADIGSYDHAGDWFSTGTTAMNTLAMSMGNDKVQTYFSYANTAASGIVDSN